MHTYGTTGVHLINERLKSDLFPQKAIEESQN
jgi:hypothetical protein